MSRKKKATNHHKKWTTEEDEFLIDKLGIFSYNGIAKALNREPTSIEWRRKKLGLCEPKEADGLITINYLAECLDIDNKIINKWNKKHELKVRFKNIAFNKKISRIKTSDFWKWAETHKELINWEKFKEDNLGVEPNWVKETRKNHKTPKKRYAGWTAKEMELLKSYYKLGIPVDIIAKNLDRTVSSIYARANIEEIKRTEPTINWTNEKKEKLNKLLSEGLTMPQIAEKMDKTLRSVQNAKFRYKIEI